MSFAKFIKGLFLIPVVGFFLGITVLVLILPIAVVAFTALLYEDSISKNWRTASYYCAIIAEIFIVLGFAVPDISDTVRPLFYIPSLLVMLHCAGSMFYYNAKKKHKTKVPKSTKAPAQLEKNTQSNSQGLSKTTALLLSIFLGHMGIDRFYLGYVGMGVLKLLTGGCFGILYLIDIIRIASGKLLPANGAGYK